MAELVKTWTFDTDAEGWTFTPVNATGTYVASGGVTTGHLRVDLSGRNKTDDGSWNITTTFEALGVPAGRNVTGYGLCSFYGRCSVYNTVDYGRHGDLANTEGALFINDGTLRSLIPSQTNYTSTTAWAQFSNNPNITGLSLPSNTSITIHANHDLDLANSASAQFVLDWDNIAITVIYQDVGQTLTDSIALTNNATLLNLRNISTTQSLTLQELKELVASNIISTTQSLTLEEINNILNSSNLTSTQTLNLQQLNELLVNGGISITAILELNNTLTAEYLKNVSTYSTLEINNAINALTNAGFTVTAGLVLNYLARIYK